MSIPLFQKHLLNLTIKSKALHITDFTVSDNFSDFQPHSQVAKNNFRRDSANLLENFNTFEALLLESASDEQLLNFTNSYLDNNLWPSLEPKSWQMEAVKLLTHPEYIIMLVLCILALTMNIISIIALGHVPQRLTTHLKLIISLGIADILIILSVLLHLVHKVFNSQMNFGGTKPSERLDSACVSAAINSITVFAFLISLLNLLAMAIDHYIGIIKPFYYHRWMTRKKSYIILIVLWLMAAIGGFSNFLFGLPEYQSKQNLFNYCEYIMYDNFHAEYLVLAVTLLSLCVIIYIYLRIYFEVKKIQIRTPSFPDETLQNKKAMITTLLIIGTFSICWLPNCIFQIYMIVHIYFNNDEVYKLLKTYLLISKYLYILMLTNCLFDPVIYAVRLHIVQRGYRNLLQKTVMKFQSVRRYKCCKERKRTNSGRRGTLASDHEMANLLKHSPNTAEQTKTESLTVEARELLNDCASNSKNLDSDFNENQLTPQATAESQDQNIDQMKETII